MRPHFIKTDRQTPFPPSLTPTHIPMGGDRDYWFWGGVKSSTADKKGRGRRDNRKSPSDTAPAGCINAVLQLLDFHHLQFGIRVTNDREPSPSPSSPKGTEAPRNSLELDVDYGDLNVPMGMGIQIRTSLEKRAQVSGSKEIDSSSGGNRTPTLVARLMGLDILPESCSSSPMPPYSERKPNCPNNRIRTTQMHRGRRSCGADTETMKYGGTRSLPETPRVSLARRSTEATVDHRLSLQIINKENANSCEEFDLSRFRTLIRRKEAELRELEENRSPSYSARQSANKVGRKVGVDITNTVKNRERENPIHHIKSKQESSSRKIRNKNSKDHKSRCFVVDIPKLLTFEEEPQAKCNQRTKRSSTIVDERFDSRLKKPVRNQLEEAAIFVRRRPSPSASPSQSQSQSKSGRNLPDKKCIRKSCPLPAKKDPSPPATKIPQKQPQQVHDTRESITFLPSSESSNRSSPGESRNGGYWSEESLTFYISRVLKRCCSPEESDILSSSPNFKQFSCSHVLDPFMFRLLELETNLADRMNGLLSYRCNRKLLFDLLDEILADICSDSGRRKVVSRIGRVLTRELCSTITSFPSVDCQYLEDVDRLIEGDMAKSKGSEEEVAVLALEIEEDIMDNLISETAIACGVTFT